MSIVLLRRLVRHLLGEQLVYLGARRLPRAFYGLCSVHIEQGRRTFDIVYARGLSNHERALTVLHEVCHALFDCWRGIDPGESWREDRADRYAEHILELVAAGATPTEIRALCVDHPIMQRPTTMAVAA